MHTHIREALSEMPRNFMFDGEIYLHGWSLQKINGAGGVNRLEPNDKTPLLEYHIFDMLDEDQPELGFDYRKVMLESILLFTGPVKLVQTVYITDELQGEQYFAACKSLGFEGTMYRSPSSPYGTLANCTNKENRWNCLLKRKDWLDEEVECIDFSITLGANSERGFVMTCQRDTGVTFGVGSGLSHSQRDKYETQPPIGKTVTVKYEILSDNGTPLKPTILLVHE